MEEKIEYIFCINTGRSGSGYLKNIFTHVSGCRSFHEPEPIGNEKVMRRYSRGHLEPMRKFTQEKINSIKDLKGDYQTYVETNHCFIKGFGWFVPQHLPEDRIAVIILKREKSKIAESLLRIGCSPLLPDGRNWTNTPEIKDPLVTPPKILIPPKATYQCARVIKYVLRRTSYLISRILRKEFKYNPQWLTNYELECLKWYVEETYEKTAAFKRQYPKIKYYETNIEDLNSFESVQKMLMHFGLSGKESLKNIVGKRVNLKRPEFETSQQGAAPDH
jgi:hypothetical protein